MSKQVKTMHNETVYNVDIQAKLEGWFKATGMSQAKAAGVLGINQSALSQYRRSIYHKSHGNVKEVESKLAEFLKVFDEEQAQRATGEQYRRVTGYIETSVSEDVLKTIRYCQIEKGLVVIHGDAGIGKTKAAEKFASENQSSTIYIQATPSSGTLGNILKLLARALKVNERQCKLDLIESIKYKLNGSNKIIIIDEAQHLKIAALEELRAFADSNEITGQKGTGIVLIGNTEVYSRMVGKQEARFAQLFSRIRMNRHYSTYQVKVEDIFKLFPLLKEKNMKKELKLLLAISKSKWGVRGAVNVYNNAVNNEDISYEGLTAVTQTMGIQASVV